MKPILSLPLLGALAIGLGMAFQLEFEEGPHAEFVAEEAPDAALDWTAESDLLQGFEAVESETPVAVAAAAPARPTPVARSTRPGTAPVRAAESDQTRIEEARRVLVSRDASRAARRRALDVLGTSSDPRAAEILLEAFAGIEDEGLRQEALVRLEGLGLPAESLLSLAPAVEDDPAATERLAQVVAERLRQTGESDPVRILTATAAPSGHPLVEAVLRRIDPKAQVAQAQGGLSGDVDARQAALELLASMDDSDALALIEQVLLDSNDAAARSDALAALLEGADSIDEQVLRHLVQHDEAAEVRSMAAAAMVDAEDGESLSLLVLALSSDPDANVRAAAADALASAVSVTSDLSGALLGSLANDPSEMVRAHAGRAIAARCMLDGSVGDGATAQSVEDGLGALVLGATSAEVRDVASAGIEIIRRVRETS